MRALADLLLHHGDKISRRWTERVSTVVAPPRQPELREHLPRLLRDLTEALAESHLAPTSPPPLRSDDYPAHRLGFDLRGVVHEYALLRDCILDTLEEEEELVRVSEVRILTNVLFLAIAEAVSQHAEQAQAAEVEKSAAASLASLAEQERHVAREQAARASAQAERETQHKLFMQAPVAIAILEGPEHRFTFANPAYRALVNGRDIVGKPLLEALPDLVGQSFDALLDQVMTTGDTFFGKELAIQLEHQQLGQPLFMNFVYTAKRNADGNVDGVLVSGSDVTEQVRARKRVEALAEELRESEAQLRLVADALPVLVSFVDCEERYTLVNQAYGEWFHVPHESLVGRSLREVIGEQAYALLHPYVLRALAGERFSIEQYHVPYRLGGPRDIKVWFVPRFNAVGSVEGYVALLQDITTQRRAEEAIRRQSLERLGLLEEAQRAQSKEQAARVALEEALGTAARLNAQLGESELILRNLVNNLPELAWSADPSGSIDFYNQRWFEYTGTTLEETKGWGWEKLHDPAILPEVSRRWKHSLATGEPFEMEFPLRRADGTYQWFLTRVRPLRDGSGNILRWIGTNANIHEQRAASERAEVASRAKDEFLATASHELRTPLNAILGWSRMLRSGQLEPSAYTRGLETIERNAKAQVQLIEDILDGSRIITGKLHLEIRPLDMTLLVRSALDAVRPAAEAKGIELLLDLDPAAARVFGDPERLQQVVWNLANNAVKFTPRGGSVEVRLQRAGTSIELAMSDSGQGIAEDFLPFVFDRFRQAEGGTTRRHGGLGLGLALVRHLVEAHGGTVRAESAGEGRGSRFVVQLPVQAVYEEAASSEHLPRVSLGDDAGVDKAILLEGVTILVVDDEADARELVATVLRASGAEVTLAASAVQALQLLAESSPMMLISDIGMPHVDGYDLLRRVRGSANAEVAEIPAIALTAYSREQDRRLALAAGFQSHVAKPVEPAELVRVVSSLAPRRSP